MFFFTKYNINPLNQGILSSEGDHYRGTPLWFNYVHGPREQPLSNCRQSEIDLFGNRWGVSGVRSGN